MSRLSRWFERPISERDRQRAFALVVVGLLGAAVALTAIDRPAPRDEPASRAPAIAAGPAPSPPSARPRAVHLAPPARVRRVSRRCLTGWLGYVYGRRPARRIVGVSRALRRQLARRPVRIAPRARRGARRRHPRVLALSGRRVAAGWLLHARVADGSGVAFPVELLVAVRRGRPVVTRIGNDR